MKLGSTSRPLSRSAQVRRSSGDSRRNCPDVARPPPGQGESCFDSPALRGPGRLGRLRQPAQDLPDQRASRLPALGRNTAERRSILLLSEQGIGDQVMFASCLPDLLATAGPIVVECDARLVPLYVRSFPKITAIPKPRPRTALSAVGPCDVVDSIASLPRFLRRRIEDFPERSAYLAPIPSVAFTGDRPLRTGSALKVGVSWHGGKDAETRRRRSVALELWGPILRVPGVRFNIQYGAAAAEAVRAARFSPSAR